MALSSTELETRLLHKLLLAFNAPADWHWSLIAAVMLLPMGGVAGFWWLLAGRAAALYAAIVLLFFASADALVLVSLLRWRISFGPVGPQLYSLEAPRLLVAMLVAPGLTWFGLAPVLSALVIINIGASAALVWGAFVEPQRLGLTRIPLTVDSFPGDVPSLRLLHISDLHVERFGRREEQLLQMVRAVEPDLIVLTGDYINLSFVDDPIARADTQRVLAGLVPGTKNPVLTQVYAVLGSPPVDRNSASLFDGLPIRLLRDEMAVVDLPPAAVRDGSKGESTGIRGQSPRLALLGLDCSHNPQHDAGRLAAVAAQAPADALRVLLYHSPELMPVAAKLDIKLYLCGHTHGGQVRLPFYGALLTSSRLGKRFEMGCYRLAHTLLYVSRGVGLEGMSAPRVRFLCPPEIALFSINGRANK
jgi:predicted MPP superfamily phosphohydrolase